MGLSRAQATASVDTHLTNMITSYTPDSFVPVNDMVAPPLDLPDISSGFMEHETDDWSANHTDEWNDSQGANEIDVDKPTKVPFVVPLYSYRVCLTEKKIKEREQSGESRDSFVQRKVLALTNKLLLKRELRLASKITTAANYDSGMSGAASAYWSAAGGDPVGNTETALAALSGRGYPATHVLCDDAAYIYLTRHVALLAYGNPQMRGRLTPEEIKAVLGVIPIVGVSKYDNAGTRTSIFGNGNVVYFHMPVVPAPAQSGVKCFARTIVAQPLLVRTWKDEPRNGTVYEVSMQYTHVWGILDNATDKDSEGGYLLTGAMA